MVPGRRRSARRSRWWGAARGGAPPCASCARRKTAILEKPRTDRTTRIPSGVGFPVSANHAAKRPVFDNLINAGNLKITAPPALRSAVQVVGCEVRRCAALCDPVSLSALCELCASIAPLCCAERWFCGGALSLPHPALYTPLSLCLSPCLTPLAIGSLSALWKDCHRTAGAPLAGPGGGLGREEVRRLVRAVRVVSPSLPRRAASSLPSV